MIEKYGAKMDETEIADFKKTYEQQVEEADHILQSREDFKKADITTYEQFKQMDFEDQVYSDLHGKLFFEESIDLFWELQERESLKDFHNLQQLIINNTISAATSEQKKRLEEIKASGSHHVYPEVAFTNFKDFIMNVTIVIVISVAVMVSPLMIRDRILRVRDLQYTAKEGRKVYLKKVLAGIFSTVMVVTVLLGVYFSLYSMNHTATFFPVPIQSFIGPNFWYDLTFFQYIILTVFAIYVLGIVIAMLAMSVSTVVPNYIALIGVQVPFLYAMTSIAVSYLINQIINLGIPKWVVPVSYMGLAVLTGLLIALSVKREGVKDIV
jgi:hypothetical protein